MFLMKCVCNSKIILPICRGTRSRAVRAAFNSERCLQSSSTLYKNDKIEDDVFKKYKLPKDQEIPSFLSGRFEVLNEENSPMILDIEEERRKQSTQIDTGSVEEKEDWEEFKGVDLERGLHGVFDVEQLAELLQGDGALNLCVIRLPVELKYAEHLVIVTGRSARHRKALAQLVRRVYKKKCLRNESVPRIEGAHADGTNFDWLAMDLGNIVLHIFARSAREKYDLESLWALGSEHDVQCVKPDDPLIALLNSHSVYLGDLEPAEPSVITHADSEDTKT